MANNTTNTNKRTAREMADARALFNYKKEQLKKYGVTAQSKLTADQKKEFDKVIAEFTAKLAAPQIDSKADSKTKQKDSKTKQKSKQKDSKPKEIKTGRTGTFIEDTEQLATKIEKLVPSYKTTLNIHGDAKKKKLMVRYNGKLVTKVFIQKKGYKMHLKNKDDYKALGYDITDVFYQNGFNLAYAKKVSETVFLDAVKQLTKEAK